MQCQPRPDDVSGLLGVIEMKVLIHILIVNIFKAKMMTKTPTLH
jgi:hypothetical protein